jgi:hypothetical protein
MPLRVGGNRLLFELHFEAILSQRVNGPQETPLRLLMPFLDLLTKLTGIRVPL